MNHEFKFHGKQALNRLSTPKYRYIAKLSFNKIVGATFTYLSWDGI